MLALFADCNEVKEFAVAPFTREHHHMASEHHVALQVAFNVQRAVVLKGFKQLVQGP